MEKSNRKILLLVDNVLPLNLTSEVQPLDQGIIRVVKARYRKKMLQHLITVAEDCDTRSQFLKSISVLHAVRWVNSSWQEISPETISKCFQCSVDKIINADVELILHEEISTAPDDILQSILQQKEHSDAECYDSDNDETVNDDSLPPVAPKIMVPTIDPADEIDCVGQRGDLILGMEFWQNFKVLVDPFSQTYAASDSKHHYSLLHSSTTLRELQTLSIDETEHLRKFLDSKFDQFDKESTGETHLMKHCPLNKLTSPKVPWRWNDAEKKSFDIKKALIEAPRLYVPMPRQPLILYTDASDFGLGSILA
ncbi:uncharacterized protein LOC117175637 [Belonocnema kinseyi]|uniref:uncharacterized protein LOC117175637 n=1 Tax=Belonocnema kinseyi TaxID=2817044 RepID=UPI00143D3621|nr:uncharacterized protein LOC117175637 [Belonocnema kinseyi]